MPNEIDMIQVRQTAEQDPLIFEVVVREGKGEIRHERRAKADLGQAYAGALS